MLLRRCPPSPGVRPFHIGARLLTLWPDSAEGSCLADWARERATEEQPASPIRSLLLRRFFWCVATRTVTWSRWHAAENHQRQRHPSTSGPQQLTPQHVEVLASLPHPLVVVLAGVGEGLSATGHRAMTMRRSSQRPDHHDRTRCSTVPDCVRVCVLRRHERAVRSTRRPCWVLNSGSSGMP